uniref:Uncharacterized protein n=1 Tax=Oxyrrhis marina TaxID=2969 RepID=A0A7S3XGA6_OXYMA
MPTSTKSHKLMGIAVALCERHNRHSLSQTDSIQCCLQNCEIADVVLHRHCLVVQGLHRDTMRMRKIHEMAVREEERQFYWDKISALSSIARTGRKGSGLLLALLGAPDKY